MNRLKIDKVVAYIRSQAEFPFDLLDVQDEFSKVLGYYSLHGHLNWKEQDVLQDELLKFAEIAQTVEMTRMVHRKLDLEGKCYKSQNEKIEQSVSFLDWLKTLPKDLQESFFSSLAVKASGG